MNMLKAEEAHQLAKENSAVIQNELDRINEMIAQSAKEGRFQLNYTSETSATNLITPVLEQLSEMGYKAQSFSLKNISLTITW